MRREAQALLNEIQQRYPGKVREKLIEKLQEEKNSLTAFNAMRHEAMRAKGNKRIGKMDKERERRERYIASINEAIEGCKGGLSIWQSQEVSQKGSQQLKKLTIPVLKQESC